MNFNLIFFFILLICSCKSIKKIEYNSNFHTKNIGFVSNGIVDNRCVSIINKNLLKPEFCLSLVYWLETNEKNITGAHVLSYRILIYRGDKLIHKRKISSKSDFNEEAKKLKDTLINVKENDIFVFDKILVNRNGQKMYLPNINFIVGNFSAIPSCP